MAQNSPVTTDGVDEQILAALQQDGRQSMTELGRTVRMSSSAVTDRVRRLEEAGVIRGYRADVDAVRLGYGILAFLRLRYPSSVYTALHDLLADTPEVIESHHVTGDDCFILKVVAVSMADLERISGRIGALGSVTTSVSYSSTFPMRAIRVPRG